MVFANEGEEFVAAGFHEPAWGGGGAANAYAADIGSQQVRGDLGGILYVVGVGIDLAASLEEDLAVAALAAADEEDKVVRGGEALDVL